MFNKVINEIINLTKVNKDIYNFFKYNNKNHIYLNLPQEVLEIMRRNNLSDGQVIFVLNIIVYDIKSLYL